MYQVLPKQRVKPFIDKINFLYVLGSLANIVWIVLWVIEHIVLSTLMMAILFASLVGIYLRLDIGKTKLELKERIAVHIPFSVYLGWITVATIGNVAISLTVVDWDGFGLGEIFWTVSMILVATLVTLAIIFTRKDLGYSLVIIWALAGIITKQIEIQSIVLAASIGSILILFALVVKVLGVPHLQQSSAPWEKKIKDFKDSSLFL